MYILNIFENGVEGIKISNSKNDTKSKKIIIFLNNLVADKSQSMNDRLSYLKMLNRMGIIFYCVSEKNIEEVNKRKWYNLYNTLSVDNKRILKELLKLHKYNRKNNNKVNKKIKTKKIKLKRRINKHATLTKKYNKK
jgi:hypothetical protein